LIKSEANTKIKHPLHKPLGLNWESKICIIGWQRDQSRLIIGVFQQKRRESRSNTEVDGNPIVANKKLHLAAGETNICMYGW
jgi:hypothetical protein